MADARLAGGRGCVAFVSNSLQLFDLSGVE